MKPSEIKVATYEGHNGAQRTVRFIGGGSRVYWSADGIDRCCLLATFARWAVREVAKS